MKKKRQPEPGTFSFSSLLEWELYILIASVCFIIVVDVYDNTILKPTALVTGSILLFTMWVCKQFYEQEFKITIPSFTLPSLLFLGASALSLIKTQNLELSVTALYQLTLIILTAFLAFQLLQERDVRKRFINLLIFICIVSCVAGIAIEMSSGAGLTILAEESRQLISTYGNSAYFAGFLVLMLPFILGQLFSEKGRAKKILLSLIFITMWGTLILTRTRSSWIAAALGTVLFVLLAFSLKKIPVKIWLTGGALFALLLFIFRNTIAGRFSTLLASDSSFIRRFDFYKGGWKAFLASPIIGNGFGSFEVYYPQFRANDYWISKSEDIVAHAHNEFLEITGDSGILGIVSFILLLVVTIRFCIKKFPSLSVQERFTVSGFVSGFFALLIDSLGSMNLRVISIMLLWWLFLAFIFSFTGKESNAFSPREIRCTLSPGYRKTFLAPFAFAGLLFFFFIPHEVHRFKADGHLIRGYSYDVAGNTPMANREYSAGVKEYMGNSLLLYNAAGTDAQTGNYGTADTLCTELIKRYPAYPKSHLIMGILLFQTKHEQEGIAELQKEIANRNHPQTIFLLSTFYGKVNDTVNERKTLQELLTGALKSKSTESVATSLKRLMEIGRKEDLAQIPREPLMQIFSNDKAIVTELKLVQGKIAG